MILDALRKAEAERQRGAVPGLHSAATAAPPAATPGASRRPVWWVAVLALITALAVLAWGWRAASVAEGVPAVPTAAPVAGAAPAVPPSPAPAPVPAASWPVVVSAPPAPPPAPPPAAPAAVPAAAPIVTQVRKLAELPAEQRRELPPLVVSGSVWSDQPTARFVVLDGQVLREGERVAPGLVLVKLAPRAATLRWRDGLIEVPF